MGWTDSCTLAGARLFVTARFFVTLLLLVVPVLLLAAWCLGCGRLAVGDGKKRGSVDGGGIYLSISGRTTSTGECEIESLEGKFSIAHLVEPKIADPERADATRIKALLQHEKVYGFSYEGKRHDAGDKLGFLKATVEFALKHKELGADFRAWLKDFPV